MLMMVPMNPNVDASSSQKAQPGCPLMSCASDSSSPEVVERPRIINQHATTSHLVGDEIYE